MASVAQRCDFRPPATAERQHRSGRFDTDSFGILDDHRTPDQERSVRICPDRNGHELRIGGGIHSWSFVSPSVGDPAPPPGARFGPSTRPHGPPNALDDNGMYRSRSARTGLPVPGTTMSVRHSPKCGWPGGRFATRGSPTGVRSTALSGRPIAAVVLDEEQGGVVGQARGRVLDDLLGKAPGGFSDGELLERRADEEVGESILAE